MAEYNETILEHDGCKDYWGISTGEQKWKNRLAKLHVEHPTEVELVADNPDGGVYYRIPKSWVKITPPVKRNLTEEQRNALRERLMNARKENNT